MIKSVPGFACVYGAVMLGLGGSAVGAGSVDVLLSRVPPDANALAVVYMEKLLASPLAKGQGWSKSLGDAYGNKVFLVPPGTRTAVTAAMLRPGDLNSVWEVSVFDLDRAPDMKQLARIESGMLDELAGRPAVWSPINAIFVLLDPQTLGVVTPAYRQFATRWVQRAESTDAGSDYLRRAVGGNADAQIVLALDARDWNSAAMVRHRLEAGGVESLSSGKVPIDAAAKVIASLLGAVLEISISDSIVGKARIEFGQPIEPLAPVARDLCLEAVNRFGIGLDDFEKWKFTTRRMSLHAEGPLSPDGLARLCSFLEPPTAHDPQLAAAAGRSAGGDAGAGDSEPSAGGPGGDTAQARTAKASKAYFDTVSRMLDRLGKLSETSSSLGNSSTWIRRDVRKIANLPLLDVDPDLVQWGTDTSAKLDEIASILAVGSIDARAASESNRAYYAVGAGWGYNYDPMVRRGASAQMRAAALAEKSKAVSEASKSIRELKLATSQIRVEMTKRYGVAF